MTRRSPSRKSRSPKRANSSGMVQPGGQLDLGVGVAERQAEPGGEAAADAGLAGAHQADQHDAAARERRQAAPAQAGRSSAASGWAMLRVMVQQG